MYEPILANHHQKAHGHAKVWLQRQGVRNACIGVNMDGSVARRQFGFAKVCALRGRQNNTSHLSKRSVARPQLMELL